MVEQRRQRERADLDAAGARLPGERIQSAKHRVALEMAIRLRTQRHARAIWIDSGRAVLSRQPAAGERTERRESDSLIRAERKHLALRGAIEQAERVLHPVQAAQAAP